MLLRHKGLKHPIANMKWLLALKNRQALTVFWYTGGNAFTCAPMPRATCLSAYGRFAAFKRSFMELYDEFVPWNAVTGNGFGEPLSLDWAEQVGDLTHIFQGFPHARSESQIWRQPAFMFLFRPCSRTTCNWQTTPEPARLLSLVL